MGGKQPPEAKSDRDGGSKQANQAGQGAQEEDNNIEGGMVVEADEGDLGQEDISKAKVPDIVHDPVGNVETVVAEKGIIFKKQLDIPVERIQSVTQETGGDEPDGSPSKVIISASEEEVEALAPVGPEAFPPEDLTRPKYGDDLLDLTGEALPTDVGLRRLEEEARPDIGTSAQETGKRHGTFQMLGPGLLSGMAGNDASAVLILAGWRPKRLRPSLA